MVLFEVHQRFKGHFLSELCVSFNTILNHVDHEVVRAFACEGEGTENIMPWNPDWGPFYSMVDCCSEETNAVEALFPGS